MPRAITRCPSCREPVSPFAAGCAICGADLEAARAQLAARRRVELPRPRWFQSRAGIDWVHIAVAVLLALAFAPVGLLLSIYWAVQRYRSGETVMFAAMAATAALALAAMLAPVWFWSHLYGGL
jgi:hypothetical protein